MITVVSLSAYGVDRYGAQAMALGNYITRIRNLSMFP